MNDVIHAADESGSGTRSRTVTLIICFFIVGFDGFDAGVASYVAPVLKQLWTIDSNNLGILFGSGYLGLAIGNFILGPIADKYGRKRIAIVSMIIFGTASILAAFSPTIAWLIALRFLTGLGLGGALPNAITLATEYCPSKNKAMLLTIVLLAFPGGLALSGVTASISIPVFGWTSLFLLGGALPLLLAPVAWLFLPESLEFIQRRHRMKGPTAAATGKPAKKRVFALFGQGEWQGTAILWLTFFCSLWAYYQVTNWLPTLVAGEGVSAARAASFASLFPFGGLIGSLVGSRIMERLNRYAVLAVYYMFAAIFTGAIGLLVHSPQFLGIFVFCAGLTLGGVQTCLIYVVADYYKDEVRSTGVAWGLGVGRVGSIVGSATGGAVLAWMHSVQHAFLMFALPVLISGLGMLWMIRFTRARLTIEVEVTSGKELGGRVQDAYGAGGKARIGSSEPSTRERVNSSSP
ncbi:MFS transporter [Cupriavidus sp. CV2]|uniref:MFS transporter n=1 Tax=Cupriavidus ulmosensis TaxID=3065913 RepID=UPI00296B5086|nr:MFS transporter [Cupriavidus sp. CV2]MDW3687576.1 MFS transporter [Cupriavidus sp. CV2]